MKQKDIPLFGKKSTSFKMIDLDEGSRKVAGYFSTFNVIDSDSDMIMQGAFKKSILEAGPLSSGNRKIQHLRMHDWNRQIGKLLELKEDETGLYFVSQLGRSDDGNNAFLDYQDGIITEHSIGFNYVADKIKYIDTADGGYFAISEVRLWEGSAVTFGANEYTPVLAVAKGVDATSKYVEELQNRMQQLAKVLRNGKGTDERFLTIEAELLNLAQSYKEVIEALAQKPAFKAVAESEPKANNRDLTTFFLNLR